MPLLAEIQQRFRNAVVSNAVRDIAPLLAGGADPVRRLMIHQRNYETSLVDALLGRFPATAWLAGTPLLRRAATEFVREHPPQAPCIAEYGDGFPRFLSRCAGAEGLPYLHEFAELEWHVGCIAVAVDGVRYMRASWPVDELIMLFLTDTAPDRFEISPVHAWIEVRGGRGEFRLTRLGTAPGQNS